MFTTKYAKSNKASAKASANAGNPQDYGKKANTSKFAGGGAVAHPGFKAVEAKIGKNPKIKDPGAVLAAASRNASAAAKRANPRLKRVK